MNVIGLYWNLWWRRRIGIEISKLITDNKEENITLFY